MRLAPPSTILFFFFFNDTATTEIYTLSLHDALPISLYLSQSSFWSVSSEIAGTSAGSVSGEMNMGNQIGDRKSTRLNSSHGYISYAVFCLKKKNNEATPSPATQLPYVCESVMSYRRY